MDLYPSSVSNSQTFYPPTMSGGIPVVRVDGIPGASRFFPGMVLQGALVKVTSEIPPLVSFFSPKIEAGEIELNVDRVPPEEVVLYPTIVEGGTILLYVDTVEVGAYAYPVILSRGMPLLVYPVESTTYVYGADLSASTSVEAVPIPSGGEIYEPYVEFSLQVDAVPSTTVLYEAETSSFTYIRAEPIPSSVEIHEPGLQAYYGIVTVPIRSTVIHEPLVHSNYNVYITGYIKGTPYVYRPRLGLEVALPLMFKQANPSTKGFSRMDVAPRQSYYYVTGNQEHIADNVRTVRAQRITSDYVVSQEALFGHTYYTGFYIYNPENFKGDVRSNIFLRATGGTSFRAETLSGDRVVIREAEGLLPPGASEDLLRSGESRSSLLDQVHISFLVSPEPELMEFSPDGSSQFFDLRNKQFSPSSQPLRIPDLRAGEFQGIYMKVTTLFDPSRVVSEDYSFLNLEYTNESGPRELWSRDKYPGQTVALDDNSQTGREYLPSLRLDFYTGYDSLLRGMDLGVDRLYSKYPPYFTHYEDLD